jgi:hypothetical protein
MTFTGSALRIFWFNVVSVTVFGLLVSFGLLGGNWPYLFFASLAIMLPVVLVATLVIAWTNRFSFDDDLQAFVKPGSRRIPYNRVAVVYLADRGHSLDVFIKRGWMHRTSLVEAVPRGRAQQLRDELAARFPERIRQRGRWHAFLPVLTIFLLVSLALAGAHVFLYDRFPALRAEASALTPTKAHKPRSKPPVEFLDEIGFTPPRGFHYISEDKGVLYFEDKARRLRLKAVGGINRDILQEQAVLFRTVMGVNSYADLMDLAYHARVGIIPLFLRALDLVGLDQVALYTAEKPLRVFISQGKRGKEEETHIALFGGRPDQEVHFFFFGPTRVPEKDLIRFIDGVVPTQLPGSGDASSPLISQPRR